MKAFLLLYFVLSGCAAAATEMEPHLRQPCDLLLHKIIEDFIHSPQGAPYFEGFDPKTVPFISSPPPGKKLWGRGWKYVSGVHFIPNHNTPTGETNVFDHARGIHLLMGIVHDGPVRLKTQGCFALGNNLQLWYLLSTKENQDQLQAGLDRIIARDAMVSPPSPAIRPQMMIPGPAPVR